jgi:hypothetical protein
LFCNNKQYGCFLAIRKKYDEISKNGNDLFWDLDLRIGYLCDERFKNNIAHALNELYAANDKVPATTDSATGYLDPQLTDHPGDVHEYSP